MIILLSLLWNEQAHTLYPYDKEYSGLDQTPRYAGEYLDLYAREDDWDQILCVGAAQAGFDIVVLTSMVGMFQVVTEVLDTRSREESFFSLLYVID